MTNFKKALVLTTSAFSLLAIATVAKAEESAIDGKITGNVAVTNNYIWRGVTQTSDLPALQGGLTYTHDSGFYVSYWGSNVASYISGGNLESDLTVGYSGSIDALTYDVGYVYYFYAGSHPNVDFSEVYASLSYDFGLAVAKAGVLYSWDAGTGVKIQTYYPYAELKIPVVKDGPLPLTIFGHAGTYQGNKTFVDYVDWNAGVTTNIVGLDLSLGYYDTSRHGDLGNSPANGATLNKAKFAAVLSKSF